MRYHLTIACLVLAGLSGATWADLPPGAINYQGVLRDSSNEPLDGTFDMVFRFFDASVAGNEILVDRHLGADALGVVVSGGMFDVRLGTGLVADGSGPGTYLDLAQLFKDHGTVYVQIEVDSEVLDPRVPVASAAYALNSSNLGGRSPDEYLDTTGTLQTKTGRLVVDASTAPADFGIRGYGPTGGGYFQDSDSGAYARLGFGNRGLEAYGSYTGAYFAATGGSAVTYVAQQDKGIDARGADMGAELWNLTDNSYALAAQGGYGIKGFGPMGGGYFADQNGSGWAAAASGDYGIMAQGSAAGATFADSDGTGYANVGAGDIGIEAFGNHGAYFQSLLGNGHAYVGSTTYGIGAYGSTAGGYFGDTDSGAETYVAFGNDGVWASGAQTGGFFRNDAGNGFARLADVDEGVSAGGNLRGGYLYDLNSSGEAYLGYGDYGIQAYGDSAGGYFYEGDTAAYSFQAYLGWGSKASGPTGGGEFSDSNSSAFARVGYGTYKIQGSGTVSFVQNHPTDPDEVIVYHAPEGDEVATYTRGTARLVDGEARVGLGETFAWVTNPDLGLTAHLTPHGDAVPLAIAALTTHELVVRGADGGPADLTFDYIVYGLRIGFEEVSVVQEKQREARIPSMSEHRDLYARRPELRRFNSMERYKDMTADVRGVGREKLDLNRAAALRDAVQEYAPEVHGAEGVALPARDTPERVQPANSAPSTTPAVARRAAAGAAPIVTAARTGAEPPADEASGERGFPMSVAGTVEVGDVLVFDLERPGRLSVAVAPYDSGVAGVALGRSFQASDGSEASGLEAPVAFTGVVPCKVDASYAAIRPGDLLTTSPTPGHAMLAIDPGPGTVIGKAVEPLDSGTATIRVLVMSR